MILLLLTLSGWFMVCVHPLHPSLCNTTTKVPPCAASMHNLHVYTHTHTLEVNVHRYISTYNIIHSLFRSNHFLDRRWRRILRLRLC
jgi:hypothetical protein